uniref:Uncharacterized protein n=1 Tax=Rhizophora mucronata TaxID=61149 RepID=A0A2P2JLY8_RHIMU
MKCNLKVKLFKTFIPWCQQKICITCSKIVYIFNYGFC